MPCGLPWSALMLATSSGDAESVGAAMPVFALATSLPLLIAQRLTGPLPWIARWQATGNRLAGVLIRVLASGAIVTTITSGVPGFLCLPAR